jgi:predicted ATPase
MADREVPFERQVRAGLTRLHDLPYLQTHPLGGLRGKTLQAALTEAVEGLRSGGDGAAGRTQRLLALRYVEGLDSSEVAARLGISMGEYYREHAAALAAVASLLGERLPVALATAATTAVAAAPATEPAATPLAPTTASAATPPAPATGLTTTPPAPATAPAAAPAARAGSLPRRIDAFVGREREVAEVRRLLAASPLLTLVGPGGVGKTRLALEAADGLSEQQAWLVELAPLGAGALVAPAVAAAVGAPVAGDPLRGLAEWLGGRAGLLLLDNCEHLVEACASLATTLLGACPGLRVLATSREPLGAAGEVIWSVPPLEPEPAAALFVRRAAAARPAFAITPANREAVARICARLDGLPLAIELAAARVRALSPAEIADRLDGARFGQRPELDLLTASGRGAPARHQTLRATVEWSHELLTDEERELFRRLSVFAGWLDLAAAEAVAGATAETLARLVDRSLVEADPRDEGTRYRLLETLRQYAAERLAAAGEEAAFRDRHLAYYLALAEALEPGMWGSGERPGVDRLEAAHDNLRAALDRGLASDPEAALRLAAALWWFWRLSGHHYQGRRYLRAALGVAPADAPSRPHALAGAATLSRDLGEMEEMRSLAEEAVALAEAAGNHRSAGLALGNLAFLAAPDEFAAVQRRSLEHYRAVDFGWGITGAFSSLGLRALQRGDVAEARAQLEVALAEARRSGSPMSEATVLFYLAMTAYGAGQLERAEALLDEAYPVALTSSLLGVGRTFAQARGWVRLNRGDIDGAAAMFRAAVRNETPPGRARPPFASYGSPLYWLGLAILRGGDAERGIRLMAAGHPEAQRTPPGLGMGPGRERVEAALEEAKAALSPDRFAALWAEGRALTADEAAAYALEETG